MDIRKVTPYEHLLLSLTVCFGRLGVCCQHCTTEFCFYASRDTTSCFQILKIDCHEETYNYVVHAHKDCMTQTLSKLHNDELFYTRLPQFDRVCCRSRSVERVKINNLSGWLTVLPVSQDHNDLTAQEYCDALQFHYQKPF